MHEDKPITHRCAYGVGEFERRRARAAFRAVDGNEVRKDIRVEHGLADAKEFGPVTDAQLEPYGLTSRQAPDSRHEFE